MKAFWLALLVSFTTLLNLSAKEFPGYYVSLAGDTVECKFDVKVNLFNKKLLNQLSFRKKVKIINPNGLTVKYSPDEIKSFQIDQTSEGSETYVPQRINGKKWFVRQMNTGKVNLFVYYFPHGYDGSVMSKYMVQTSTKENKLIPLAQWRKKLLEYVNQDAWFMKTLQDKSLKYQDIPALVEQYNGRT
jgi:hypothetical protein